MPLPHTESFSPHPSEARLLEFFIRLALAFGLPRSLGQIYGTLFCAREPLAFDELTHRSQVSKGAVSQGVRALVSLRAVRTHIVPNDRRTFFVAETSMKRLVSSLVKDAVEPFLDQNEATLHDIVDDLTANTAPYPSSNGDSADAHDFLAQRVRLLANWHSEIKNLLPLVTSLSAPPAPEPKPDPTSA